MLDTLKELYSLMPDSLLFGSMVLYFLTQNVSYGTFAIFMLEVVLSHRLLTWFFNGVLGSGSPQTMTVADVRCRAGYKTPRSAMDRMFRASYPSYGMYSMTAVAAYLAMSMSAFSDTLTEMDKTSGQGTSSDWNWRPLVAYIMIGLFLLSYLLIYRSAMCNDALGELMIAMFFGAMIGYFAMKAHYTFFGAESINFLGLPFLKDKTAEGNPIYICSSNPA